MICCSVEHKLSNNQQTQRNMNVEKRWNFWPLLSRRKRANNLICSMSKPIRKQRKAWASSRVDSNLSIEFRWELVTSVPVNSLQSLYSLGVCCVAESSQSNSLQALLYVYFGCLWIFELFVAARARTWCKTAKPRNARQPIRLLGAEVHSNPWFCCFASNWA